MSKTVEQIVQNIITTKPGADTLSKRKIYNVLEKKGICKDDTIIDENLAEMRQVLVERIHDLLIEKNIEERRKMGDLTLEDLYSLVRQTTSYHYKSLREHQIDPEDIVQNVMIKAYNNWEDFRGECQLATWVFRIVKNEVINMLIYHNRMKRKAAGTVDIDDSDIDFEDGNGTLEDGLIREEEMEAVDKAVATLPNKQDRKIVKMLLKGGDYKSIAKELGISGVVVRAAIHNAKQVLRVEGDC